MKDEKTIEESYKIRLQPEMVRFLPKMEEEHLELRNQVVSIVYGKSSVE